MKRTIANRLGVAGWAFVLVMLIGGGSALAATYTSTTAPASASASSWTVYHGNQQGTGVAAGVTSVNLSARTWTSPTLDGELYTEPLVFDGMVFVATENDTVYALSTTNGSVVWSTHVGTPVPSSSLPCGDITPTVGITGTPVVDPSRNEIFAVADELVKGRPAHVLIGLDASTGEIGLSQDVDPAGATPANLLQRTGLTLDSGRVVFAMGGNFGDCASYRGRVIGVPEAGGTPDVFTVDAAGTENQGAIWMGGAAPVVDPNGDVWVAVGNGSVTSSSQPYDDSDSALELSPSLTLEQYFAPSDWPTNNARDLDMSIAPALLPDGQVVLAGKSRIVYLLNGTTLGGIGGQQADLPGACSEDLAGGVAVQGTVVYLPCAGGPVAVQVSSSPPALHLLWSASVGSGPPILADGLVWSIDQDGTLYGLNPSSGAVKAHATVGAEANHFPTPSVGAGLMLAPAATRVVAFAAPSSTQNTTTTSTQGPTTTIAPTTTTTVQAASTSSDDWIVAAIVVGGLVVAGGLTWNLNRRRRRRP